MEAIRTSETSSHFNVITRRYIPKDSKLHTRRRYNLKSHTVTQCLWTAATNRPLVHPPCDIWVQRATVGWCWQSKQGELGAKPAPVPFCLWRQYAPLKRRSTSTWLHGATSQKTLNFILAAVRTWNLTQWHNVSELRPPTSSSPMWYMSMESHGGMMLTE
jgi:hypothetical protein